MSVVIHPRSDPRVKAELQKRVAEHSRSMENRGSGYSSPRLCWPRVRSLFTAHQTFGDLGGVELDYAAGQTHQWSSARDHSSSRTNVVSELLRPVEGHACSSLGARERRW